MLDLNWERVESRRRPWTPNEPEVNSESCEFSDDPAFIRVMSRCLALTPLEPAVAEFITEGLDRVDRSKVSDAAINTLRLNIKDEEKHEVALNRAMAAWIEYDRSQEEAAKPLIAAWSALDVNPILKTAVLEQSIFMLGLTIFSRFGGISLRVTAQDISRDEVRHASANKAVAAMLGSRPSKALMSLRTETLAFMFDGLNHRGYTLDRMITNSDKLLRTGKTDFTDTAEGVVYAPFEIKRTNASDYN